jgi:branched-chain amino acid transport system substrate-binding protein
VLDPRALTKIQSAALIAVIAVAAVAGSLAYMLWSGPAQSTETIKIGICADLDNAIGSGVWRAAILAAEQVNAEGGVLGRNFTIVAEDDDDEGPPDIAVISNAMTRLITVDKADFVITTIGEPQTFSVHQEICAQQNKIMFGIRTGLDEFTQLVIDNYDKYKNFFKLFAPNSTATAATLLEDVVTVRNYSGFNKVAILAQDLAMGRTTMELLNSSLIARGFDIVYSNKVAPAVTDFTSYFAAIEASGAQILVPLTYTRANIPFVKEWHDRQSPFVVLGVLALSTDMNFWDLTEGKCEYISSYAPPVAFGYPLTSKTVPTRDAYLERWGTTIPAGQAAATYDGIRFILPDALKRAGTTETEAVIKTLETTNVETSLARHFVFTKSHDLMITAAGSNTSLEEHFLIGLFQWQANKTMVPIVPEGLSREAGATYKYPPWPGPWDKKQTP